LIAGQFTAVVSRLRAYNQHMAHSDEAHRLRAVPLFPLPNVVLFPRAVLPLHIFEERYKTMTAQALDSDGLIAMALLKSGWERDYYSKPGIESVVCVGRILTHERLPDGKYNFLLEGQTRAKVVQELAIDMPFRVAELEPLVETRTMEIDLVTQRQRLATIFSDRLPQSMALVKQFRQMLTSPMSTADVADLIAFNLLEDVPEKQRLLAETNVTYRVNRVISALEKLEAIQPAIPATLSGDRPSLN
jgi:Lon protease-like protein